MTARLHSFVMEGEGVIAKTFNAFVDGADKGTSKATMFAVAWEMLKGVVSGNGMAMQTATAILEDLNKASEREAQTVAAATDQHKAAAQVVDAHRQAFDFLVKTERDSAKPLLDWQKEYLDHLAKIGLLTAQNAAGLGVSVDQLERYKKAAEAAKEAESEAAKHTAASLVETTRLWDEHFAIIDSRGAGAIDKLMTQTQRWFDDEVAKLKADDRAWTEHWQALVQVANDRNEEILHAATARQYKSRDDLQAAAADQQRIWDYMLEHATDFTNAEFQLQADRMRDATQSAMHWKDAIDAALTTIKAAGGEAAAAVDKITDAERKAREEAERLRNAGNSITYDLTTPEGLAYYKSLSPAAGYKISDQAIIDFAKKGGTLQQLFQQGLINPYAGFGGPFGNMPRFAEGISNFGGGTAIVGERGPEILNLPRGTDVMPLPSGRSTIRS